MLIKYNSTEAAVSSVNPDEQRMNQPARKRDERGEEERERERKREGGKESILRA